MNLKDCYSKNIQKGKKKELINAVEKQKIYEEIMAFICFENEIN